MWTLTREDPAAFLKGTMERILTPLSVMMYWLLLTVMGFYDHTVKQLLQCIMDTNVNIIIIIIIITIILI